MRFTCTKRDLRDTFKSLSAVSSKSVFKHDWVLVEASKKSGGVRFRAFNHVMTFQCIIRDGVNVEKHGRIKCYIPALKYISEKLKLSGSENVTIFRDDAGIVQIVSGKARFEIGTSDPTDFPTTKDVEISEEIEVQCEPFKKMISRVTPIFTQDVPYVRIETSGQKMYAVAADGPRMAVDAIDIISDIESSFQVSHLAAGIMAKVSNSRSGIVNIGWGDKDIRVRFEDTTLVVGRATGGFIPWRSMIEQFSKSPIEATLDVTEFRSIVDSFDYFYEKEVLCPLKMKFTPGKLEASMRNVGQGKGAGYWDMECDYEGEDFEIELNSRWMYQFLGGLLGSKMTMRMVDSASPVFLEFDKVEDKERTTTCENLKYMLCPIHMMQKK